MRGPWRAGGGHDPLRHRSGRTDGGGDVVAPPRLLKHLRFRLNAFSDLRTSRVRTTRTLSRLGDEQPWAVGIRASMNRGDAPGRSTFPSNPESLSRWRPCAAFACGLLIFLAQIFDAGSVKADSLDMTESSSSPPWFTGTLLSTRGRTIDRGHMVTQSYVYLTRFGGLYNDNWLL